MIARLLGITATTGLLAALGASGAMAQTTACSGGAQRCSASFSLTGGASNRPLVVRLPGTDLQLLSVAASPGDVRGAYDLSAGHFAKAGAQYQATLSAVGSIGPGAKLTLTFGRPATNAARACGDLWWTLAGATIKTASLRAQGAGCATARRITTQCVSATGPAGWVATHAGKLVVLTRGAQRVTFRPVNVRQSCVPSG